MTNVGIVIPTYELRSYRFSKFARITVKSPRYTTVNVVLAFAVSVLIFYGLFVGVADRFSLKPRDDAQRVSPTDTDARDPLDQWVQLLVVIPALILVRFGLFRVWKWPPYDNVGSKTK